MDFVNLFGVKLGKLDKSSLRDYLAQTINGDRLVKIYKANTDFLKRAMDNPEFADLLRESDLNIVDGRGVLWTAKYLSLPTAKNKILKSFHSIWQMVYSGALIIFKPGYIRHPIPDAIPGIEAFDIVMSVAESEKKTVFIFGATKEVLGLAVKNIHKTFPNLGVAGFLDGYSYQKDEKIDPIEIINSTDAEVLIVALGSPRQEKWIRENAGKLENIKIAVGEGGTLDRVAHPRKKAPKFINRIGVEWLWRGIFNRDLTGSSRLKKVWRSVPVYITQVVKAENKKWLN